MGKKRAANRPVFGEDEEEGGSMSSYLEDRQRKARKNMQHAASDVSKALTFDSEPEAPKQNNQNVMNKLLQSKQRREVDRLNTRSMKLQLEVQEAGADVPVFTTDTYQTKKWDIAKNSLVRDTTTSATDVPITMEESITGKIAVATSKTLVKRSRETRHRNDVYQNPSYIIPPTSKQSFLDKLELPTRKLYIQQFLTSSKTDEDIAKLRDAYQLRSRNMQIK